jgi:hypothetical protein
MNPTTEYPRYDWFKITTGSGDEMMFRASIYGDNHNAAVAAMKAADMLRAAGISCSIESTIWMWTEERDRNRPVYRAS